MIEWRGTWPEPVFSDCLRFKIEQSYSNAYFKFVLLDNKAQTYSYHTTLDGAKGAALSRLSPLELLARQSDG